MYPNMNGMGNSNDYQNQYYGQQMYGNQNFQQNSNMGMMQNQSNGFVNVQNMQNYPMNNQMHGMMQNNQSMGNFGMNQQTSNNFSMMNQQTMGNNYNQNQNFMNNTNYQTNQMNQMNSFNNMNNYNQQNNNTNMQQMMQKQMLQQQIIQKKQQLMEKQRLLMEQKKRQKLIEERQRLLKQRQMMQQQRQILMNNQNQGQMMRQQYTNYQQMQNGHQQNYSNNFNQNLISLNRMMCGLSLDNSSNNMNTNFNQFQIKQQNNNAMQMKHQNNNMIKIKHQNNVQPILNTTVKGVWKEGLNEGWMSPSNPQVELIVKKQGLLSFKLESSLGSKNLAMQIVLAWGKEPGRTELEKECVIAKSKLLLASEVELKHEVLPGRYIIVCCLQKPGFSGAFELSVKSKEDYGSIKDYLTSFTLLKENFRVTKQGNWFKHNSGWMSLQNPQYLLEITEKIKVKITLQDGDDDNSLIFFVCHAPQRDGKRRKKKTDKDVIAKSDYVYTDIMTKSIELDPFENGYYSKFLIVPCSGKKKAINFKLSVECEEKYGHCIRNFQEIQETQIRYKEDTCQSIIEKYIDDPKNPQFLSQNPILEIMNYCQFNNCVFKDSYFPANDESLNKDDGRNKRTFSDIVWKRTQDVLDDPKLFEDGIEPSDLNQGSVGNCWLINSIATLSLEENRILNLIFPKQYSNYGVYVFKLYFQGTWKYVVVDDYIPVKKKTFNYVFASSNQKNEVWVPLFEKAFAKAFSSYRALIAHPIAVGLEMLSGGETEYNSHSNLKTYEEKDTFWNKLLKYNQKNYLLGATSHGNSDKETNNGIVGNHAYSVIEIIEINSLRLLKLRNPWGKGEWSGDFSDDDQENWTPQLKEMVNFEESDGDDGIFFMLYDSYLKEFVGSTFCKIPNGSYSHSYVSEGDWKQNFGGTHDQEGNNPKIALKVYKNNTKIKLEMFRTAKNVNVNDNSIVMHLVTGKRIPEDIPDSQKLVSSKFQYAKKVKLSIVLNPGIYHVVPCITKKTNETYKLVLHSNNACEFGGDYIDPLPYFYNLKGSWTANFGYMDVKNMKFLMKLNQKTEFVIKFRRTDKLGNTGMTFCICKPGSLLNNTQIQKSEIVEKSKYIISKSLEINVTLDPHFQPYIIIPSLQNQMHGCSYCLEIKSSNPIQLQRM